MNLDMNFPNEFLFKKFLEFRRDVMWDLPGKVMKALYGLFLSLFGNFY